MNPYEQPRYPSTYATHANSVSSHTTIPKANLSGTQQFQGAPLPISTEPINVASKVAEVFLTAGHAFEKLADLSMQLHDPEKKHDEGKWNEKNADQLRNSLSKFEVEMDTISESVQGRTKRHVKTDIKKRQMLREDKDIRGTAYKRSIPTAYASGPIPAKRMSTMTFANSTPTARLIPVEHPNQMNHPLQIRTVRLVHPNQSNSLPQLRTVRLLPSNYTNNPPELQRN